MPDAPWQSALARLREGNARYQAFRQAHPRLDPEWRAELAAGQNPFAAVLGCADSRVPPELIFDQGLGDLFVVRVAGNVVDETVLGSLEFAVNRLEVPLVLVLGHEGCGAVTAALGDAPPPGALGALVRRVNPALQHAELPPDGAERVNAAARANARHVAQALSEALPGVTGAARTRVLPAFYRLEDGAVELLEPAP
jgi:carbonic anhydrase